MYARIGAEPLEAAWLCRRVGKASKRRQVAALQIVAEYSRAFMAAARWCSGKPVLIRFDWCPFVVESNCQVSGGSASQGVRSGRLDVTQLASDAGAKLAPEHGGIRPGCNPVARQPPRGAAKVKQQPANYHGGNLRFIRNHPGMRPVGPVRSARASSRRTSFFTNAPTRCRAR